VSVPDGEVEPGSLWRLGGGTVGSDGSFSGRYGGTTWGALFHRAPDVLFALLEDAGDALTAIERDDVETYLNTGGADDFFLLDIVDDTGAGSEPGGTVTVATPSGERYRVESEYVVPFLESPRSVDALRVTAETPSGHLLAIPPSVDRDTLREQAVWSYIRWGEREGFDAASGRRRADRWEVLPAQAYRSGRLLVGCYMGSPRVFHNPHEVVAHRLFRIDPGDRDDVHLAASLNSAVTLLSYELFRNPGLGGGVLAVSTDSVARFLVVDPAEMALADATVERFLTREQDDIFAELGLDPDRPIAEQTPDPYPDRRAVDEAAFDALELPESERTSVYRALATLVKSRRS
jgi:hypothetical protein